MSKPRVGHAAAKLPTGELIVGGEGVFPDSDLAETEIYVPKFT
jgi:hypothetical protein